MKTTLMLVTIVAGLVLASVAQAAPSPSASARAIRDCLRAHGWTAVLADAGTAVNGKAPRKLAAYPYRPWYSVSVSPYLTHGYAETRLKLNGAEARVATACRNAGLR